MSMSSPPKSPATSFEDDPDPEAEMEQDLVQKEKAKVLDLIRKDPEEWLTVILKYFQGQHQCSSPCPDR